MTIVWSTLKNPAGSPLVGCRITAALYASSAWLDNHIGQILGIVETKTDEDGLWELDLTPTGLMESTDAYYVIVEHFTNSTYVKSNIAVPDDENEHLLRSLLIEVPTPTGFIPTKFLNDLVDVDTTGATDTQVLSYDQGSNSWLPVDLDTGTGSQLTDHGDLDGLSGDDHTQYLTVIRGDARYYTELEVDTALVAKASSVHTHPSSDIGLGNVNNTSDANKPISTAQQTALDLKSNNNDSRLSDARTPLAHSHTTSDVTGLATVATSGSHASLSNLTTGDPHTQYQLRSERGSASGYAPLDSNGNVPTANQYLASPSQRGVVQLAGDLAGSSTAPTIRTSLNDPSTSTPGLRTLGTGSQQAAAGNHNHSLFARKTSNEIAPQSSTTLQDDDHLTFTVPADIIYKVDGVLIYDASTVADMKVSFSGPLGTTFDWYADGLSSAATSAVSSTNMAARSIGDTVIMGGVGVGTKIVAPIHGLLVVGNTAGTFKLQWAQNSSEASNVTIFANSYLDLKQVA